MIVVEDHVGMTVAICTNGAVACVALINQVPVVLLVVRFQTGATFKIARAIVTRY